MLRDRAEQLERRAAEFCDGAHAASDEVKVEIPPAKRQRPAARLDRRQH